jgi:hypothetical protein
MMTMVRRSSCALLLVLALVGTLCAAPVAQAGTQDFTLVNSSGVDIYELYISESANDDWEEDVLGDGILADGARIDITFSGRSACLWDMKAVDGEGTSVLWNGVNLCTTSVVVLRCGDEGCWAETE